MTNKIIAVLGACVIALAILAYNLWSDDKAEKASKFEETAKVDGDNSVEPERVLLEQPEIKNEHKDDKLDASVVEEQNEAAEVSQNEKLCQLANKYNDWYPKNNTYESESFMQEVKAWAFARGYFETEYSKGSVDIKKKSDYDYYDIEDLKEMAHAGDSMANVRLAYRMYLNRGEGGLEAAQPYCERAIVDGYTALTMCKSSYLIGLLNEERRKEKDDIDRDKLRQLELEFLGWQGVPEALGDELSSKLDLFLLPEAEFEFEPETIQQKTSGIVGSIKQQRAQLGIAEIEYPPAPDLLLYVLDNAENIQEDINGCFE